MWSKGATKGRSSEEPGILPLCGAHHRSIADQILGNTKARPKACGWHLSQHDVQPSKKVRHVSGSGIAPWQTC